MRNTKICYFFIYFFLKATENADPSLYPNLLYLQMDITLFAFDFFIEKGNTLDHFVTLTHVNSR